MEQMTASLQMKRVCPVGRHLATQLCRVWLQMTSQKQDGHSWKVDILASLLNNGKKLRCVIYIYT